MIYNLRYTRLIYSKKLPDRFLSCQVTTGSEADTAGKRGTILTLIEINSPWQQATTMGQLMGNRVAREFYRGTSSNDVINFENAVRTVNEAIASNEMEKDPQWRQKINAFMALVIENEVHFTQIGNVWSDILRKKKLLKVSDPDTQGNAPGNFIFSSLTSGHLEDDDILMVGTKKMLENPLEIDASIQHPSQISPYIIGQEKNHSIFSGIILQLNTKESLTEKEAGNFPAVIYLDQPLELVGKKIQYTVKNSLIPTLKSSMDHSVNFGKKIHQYTKEKIWPHTSAIISKVYLKTASNLQKINSSKSKTSTPTEQVKSSNYSVNYYNKSARKVGSNLAIKFNFLNRKLKKNTLLSLAMFKGKNLYITISVILVLILGIILINRYNQTPKISSSEDLKTKLAQIVKQSDEARNAILYNDTEKARTILKKALSDAEDLKKTKGSSSEIDTQIEQLNLQLDQIDKVTRLNHEIKINAPENAQKIFSLSGKLWSISTNGDIYSAAAAGGNFNKLNDKVNQLQAATSSEKSNLIYIQDSSNKIFSLSATTSSVSEQKLNSGEWGKTVAISAYVNNLYMINPTLDNILKYPSNSTGYSEGQTYLSKNIADIKDLSVDGSIFVLLEDGTIKKFEKNKATDISISELPSTLNQHDFSHIYTSVDREYLYLSTANKLIVLDKTGKFINQYAFDQIDTIKSFYMSDKGTLIWILTSDSVMSYNLR